MSVSGVEGREVPLLVNWIDFAFFVLVDVGVG